MTPDPRTEEIRARVAALRHDVTEFNSDTEEDRFTRAVVGRMFNSHAPADLAYLLGRIEALESWRDRWQDAAETSESLIDDLRAERDRLEADRQRIYDIYECWEGSGPLPTIDDLCEWIERDKDEAHEHQECPHYCDLCGERLADTDCEHCHGSGGDIAVIESSGAYSECEWCAGAGKVHTGCANASYADLVAERDRYRAELNDALSLAADYSISNDLLTDVEDAAREVMRLLAEHGASIVPHLMDDDENAGQRLRAALDALDGAGC